MIFILSPTTVSGIIVNCRTNCGSASSRVLSQLLIQQQLKCHALIAWVWIQLNYTVALRQRVPPASGCVWRHSQTSGLNHGMNLIESVCQSFQKQVSSIVLMKVMWLMCVSTYWYILSCPCSSVPKQTIMHCSKRKTLIWKVAYNCKKLTVWLDNVDVFCDLN